MKKFLKRVRMLLLLTFRYNIKKTGKNFHMGNGNMIRCKNLIIGNSVYMGNNCHLSLDSIHIDDYALLASQVSIVGGDHRFDVVGVPIRDTGRAIRKGVYIGKDSWIGHGVIIMDGVNIGEGAVIAAGAVVTKSVEPYTVYAGIPARKLRNRFSEQEVIEHKRINNFN